MTNGRMMLTGAVAGARRRSGDGARRRPRRRARMRISKARASPASSSSSSASRAPASSSTSRSGERPQARPARRAPARGRQVRAGLRRGRRPLRSGPGEQHRSRRQPSVPHGRHPQPRSRQGRQGHAEGGDDARHDLGRAALALRRRRHRRHHSRQRGQGDHRRAEVRRQRRPARRLRRARQVAHVVVTSHRNQPRFTGFSAPVAGSRRRARCAALRANSSSCVITSAPMPRPLPVTAIDGVGKRARARPPAASAPGCSRTSSAGPSAIGAREVDARADVAAEPRR